MRQRKTFSLLALVVAVMLLGVAYAAIQNVTLSVAGNVTASPDQGNFKIGFTGKYTFTGEPVESRASGKQIIGYVYDEEEDGLFNPAAGGGIYVFMYIDNLSVKGDKGTMKFEIENSSTDIAAVLSATASMNVSDAGYYDADYFDIDCSIATNTLGPGQTTWLTVTAELIKTPIEELVETGIGVQLTASPTEGGANLISFTIDGETFYAERGMTFEEWAGSEYDTLGGEWVDSKYMYHTEDGYNFAIEPMDFEREWELVFPTILEGHDYWTTEL